MAQLVWKCAVLIVGLIVLASGYNYLITNAQYSWLKVLLSKKDFSTFYSPEAKNIKRLMGFMFYGYLLFEENGNKVTDTFKWCLKETHSPRTRKRISFVLQVGNLLNVQSQKQKWGSISTFMDLPSDYGSLFPA